MFVYNSEQVSVSVAFHTLHYPYIFPENYFMLVILQVTYFMTSRLLHDAIFTNLNFRTHAHSEFSRESGVTGMGSLNERFEPRLLTPLNLSKVAQKSNGCVNRRSKFVS